MTTLTLPLDEELAARLRAVAEARGQDPNQYAVAALAQAVDRDAAEQRQRDEAQAVLNGPFHPFNADAIYWKYAERHGLPDLSELSPEQLAEQAEEIIARMDPAARAEMERQGLLRPTRRG
jgi:hypothetical protein